MKTKSVASILPYSPCLHSRLSNHNPFLFIQMKKISIIILFALSVVSCKKSSSSDPSALTNQNNYDTNNRIFRVKASSTAPYKILVTEYNSDGTTIYNSQSSEGSGPFDYGFTPVIGHKITIRAQSAAGTLSAYTLYKGVYLDPVTIQTVGSGSTASFDFTASN